MTLKQQQEQILEQMQKIENIDDIKSVSLGMLFAIHLYIKSIDEYSKQIKISDEIFLNYLIELSEHILLITKCFQESDSETELKILLNQLSK